MSVALQQGSIFAGRYRVERCIAMGGMGAVYEVVHLETERHRALKVMLPHVLQSPDHRQRFAREAKVAAYIKSEFIVDVFDAGVDEATRMPFLVMELLEGEELSARLERLGRLPPDEVITYLHQTALALDRTHKASIVHRDLKPQNLFLTAREDGVPHIKVLDFGIAKILADTAAGGATTTTFGTPLYMAPEQFVTDSGITPAADIFALGMIAFTLLVGRSYWTADMSPGANVIAFALLASKGPQEPASVRAAALGVTLPIGFDAWFARVTAFQPEARFERATMAVAALAEVFGLPPPVTFATQWQGYSESALQRVAIPVTAPSLTNAGIAKTGMLPRQRASNRLTTVVALGIGVALGILILVRVQGMLPTAPMDHTPLLAPATESTAPAATSAPVPAVETPSPTATAASSASAAHDASSASAAHAASSASAALAASAQSGKAAATAAPKAVIPVARPKKYTRD